MINLIPNEEKKNMSKEFNFRLLTVFFFILGVSFLIGSFAILPSYIFFSVEKNSINLKLEAQKNEIIPVSDQNTLTIVKDLNTKLNLLEKIQKDTTTFSERVINEIVLNKMSSIKITEISYIDDIKSGEIINVNGIAPSREALLLFQRTLEDNVSFSKVNLPISNFVRGSNIKFNISLIPS